MTNEQQTVKYISGLKYPIQERVILHNVFSVDEAHNKAMKIERLQSKILPLKSIAKKTSQQYKTQQGSTSGERPLIRKATDAVTVNPAMF